MVSINIKYYFSFILWSWRNWRAKRINKKIKKYKEEERYPENWKMQYILKKSKKVLNLFNIKLKIKNYDFLNSSPTILIVNNQSILDPAIIIQALKKQSFVPEDPQYEATFFGSKNQFHPKFINYLNILDSAIVDFSKPVSVLEEIDRLIALIKTKKKHLIIFGQEKPSKSNKTKDFWPLIFHIVKKANLPIIPVCLKNAYKINDLTRYKKLEIEVEFLKPIKPIDHLAWDKETLAIKTKELIDMILLKQ